MNRQYSTLMELTRHQGQKQDEATLNFSPGLKGAFDSTLTGKKSQRDKGTGLEDVLTPVVLRDQF